MDPGYVLQVFASFVNVEAEKRLFWSQFQHAQYIDPRHFLAAGNLNVIDLETGYQSLASVYVRDNKLDDVARVLREGLGRIPDSSALYVHLAAIYEKQHEFEKAIQVYEDLLQKNPDLILGCPGRRFV